MAKRHSNEIGNLESIFLRLEELILANSGEDEFEEVFKLVIAKIFDERSHEEKRFAIQESTTETSRVINLLLREANAVWPGILIETQSNLTPEHLAVCVDALTRHTISNDHMDILDAFFEFMVSKDSKGAKGQFFTPRHVIELCVKMMSPKQHEIIMDPACGSGGFLVHTLNHVCKNSRCGYSQHVKKFCDSNLWGFDIDGRAIRIAKTLMILASGHESNFIRLNSLLHPTSVNMFWDAKEESILTIEDICRGQMRNFKGFDVILTNPPFAGDVREKQLLRDYAIASGKTHLERDAIFVERCIQLLKPGGRMAIVLPNNKFATTSFGFLRTWIMKKARVLAVVSLGRNTFLPHTHQKASILFLQKHASVPENNYRIFFSVSERDGKNSKGQLLFRNSERFNYWENVEHDFSEIVSNFELFLEKEALEI